MLLVVVVESKVEVVWSHDLIILLASLEPSCS